MAASEKAVNVANFWAETILSFVQTPAVAVTVFVADAVAISSA